MRRNGRPPLDPLDPTVKLSVKVPSKRYDALYRSAVAERQTMSEFIRHALTQALRPSKLPPARP